MTNREILEQLKMLPTAERLKIVGRAGIMSGTQSDLRTGLARQTVMAAETPYHEPMRLLTVIEAPRARIEQVIRRHDVLQQFYQNEWVHLVALEPEEGRFYRYRPTAGWQAVAADVPSAVTDQKESTR